LDGYDIVSGATDEDALVSTLQSAFFIQPNPHALFKSHNIWKISLNLDSGKPGPSHCETTRVGKLHLNSTRNRCDLQWFLMEFQPFVVELMPLKTPLWGENYNLIPQVTVGKKHSLRLCRGGICDKILDIHNP